MLWTDSGLDEVHRLYEIELIILDNVVIITQMDKQCDSYESSEGHRRFSLFDMISICGSRSARGKYKKMQLFFYNFLERPSGAISLFYHFVVFALVSVGLVLAILETMEEANTPQLKLIIYVLETFLFIVFMLEYVLRMWSAGCRSTYVGFLGRLRFAVKPFVIVDLIVIGSTSAVILTSENNRISPAISILKFFQVLRMIRFDRQGGTWKLLGSVLFLHRQELLTTFYIGFCSLIFASFFVYLAEKGGNPDDFGTFADSFWWGVVTLTTVGYGDKVPISWTGRGVAAFFAILGISFFALPAGILGSGFALKVSHQQRQKHVKRRRRPAAMLIQCNWRYYASRKNSKSVATWSSYIKYIQERNSRKEVKEVESNFEKPSQPVGWTRKISLFGYKSSESKPYTSGNVPNNYKFRGKRNGENSQFSSNDSLVADGNTYSTVDQYTDDEHGGNAMAPKVIIVTDADGDLCLPPPYKQAIRFTRYLKFLVALRKFKLAKRPYDVKDVIEQYSSGHVELFGKIKGIGYKIDRAFGYKIGTEKIDDNPSNTRTNVVHRLSKLEKQVKTLDLKMDRVISLLENSTKKDFPVVRTLSDKGDVPPCTLCGQIYMNNEKSEECKPSLPESLKTSVRKRKRGLYNSNCRVNESSLENIELVKNEEDVTSDRLTTEDNYDLTSDQMHPLIDYYPDITTKNEPNHGEFDEKYLSPKVPFSCDSFDVRCRSDSAFSSVCSINKSKRDHSSGTSPISSDYEETIVNSTMKDQLNDTSSADTLGTSTVPLSYHSANQLQETRM